MKKKTWLVYVVSIAIALAVGGLSALFSHNCMDNFEQLQKPPLAPPGWLFPIVWTALFILMGISAALIYNSHSKEKTPALWLYAAQLFVNFWWTIIFFCWELRLFAFVWILLLIALVIGMIVRFGRINKLAAWLQAPYLLWLVFASYLNLQIFLLNG